MKLIATKPMRFAGRSLNIGDEFEANARDGRTLKAIQKARDPVASDVSPAPDPQPRDPLDRDGDGRKGGSVKGAKYKRRDMQAED